MVISVGQGGGSKAGTCPLPDCHCLASFVAQSATFPAAAAPVADAMEGVAEPLPAAAAQREWKPLTPADLVNHPDSVQQFSDYKLPAGYHWYETMIVLRAMMSDDARCGERVLGWRGRTDAGCLGWLRTCLH